MYENTLNNRDQSSVMIGSKEREYFQEEISRLTKQLNIQRKLTKDSVNLEEELSRCMKVCVQQEGQIESLKIHIENEEMKSNK